MNRRRYEYSRYSMDRLTIYINKAKSRNLSVCLSVRPRYGREQRWPGIPQIICSRRYLAAALALLFRMLSEVRPRAPGFPRSLLRALGLMTRLRGRAAPKRPPQGLAGKMPRSGILPASLINIDIKGSRFRRLCVCVRVVGESLHSKCGFTMKDSYGLLAVQSQRS